MYKEKVEKAKAEEIVIDLNIKEEKIDYDYFSPNLAVYLDKKLYKKEGEMKSEAQNEELEYSIDVKELKG